MDAISASPFSLSAKWALLFLLFFDLVFAEERLTLLTLHGPIDYTEADLAYQWIQNLRYHLHC